MSSNRREKPGELASQKLREGLSRRKWPALLKAAERSGKMVGIPAKLSLIRMWGPEDERVVFTKEHSHPTPIRGGGGEVSATFCHLLVHFVIRSFPFISFSIKIC